ncbi:MAG: acetate--CoA ligase [Thermoleophilia bacterium]|nr:acetate--CoA ligase [Thermoleophilia bacterium]
MELVNPLVGAALREARADPEGFWARRASELPWLRSWEAVLVSEPPSFRWFAGAETNLCWQCVDRHVEVGRGGHAAVVYANERGERRVLTYAQLRHEVRRCAAALRALGVGRGDRVTLSMPVCVEALVLMLATVRIGAIHSVVFAGFGAGALADRIEASGSKLVAYADAAYRRGAEVPLAGIVEEALRLGGRGVEHVVVLPRGGTTAGTGLPWADFLAGGEGGDGSFVALEANEPAWILATSGTTAKPKLTVQRHGGYAVGIHAMARACFGLEPRDVWWSTSDIGWVVGHSYILYAPLLVGCTTVAFEGALDHPGPDLLWRLVEELGVTGIFTSPTAVRSLMRHGEEPARGHDLSSLERVFCAGEVLNPPAWEWLQRAVLRDRIPVIDHWWQTETGGPVLGNPYGIAMLPIKPGSAGIALPGTEVTVVDANGRECAPGEKGMLVIDRPFPSLTAELWGEPQRYGPDYWERVPGRSVYFTGDSAHIDEDGYVWVAGRADEVINIAAHRIGTIEVETAFLKHAAVAEAGVTGRPDDVRGEVISAFVVLKVGHEPSGRLREELLQTVRHELGPVAVIGEIRFVGVLPKTRSGKIMRRVLKAVVLDQDPGDVATIEDEGSVDEARAAWRELRAGD